MKFFLIFMLFMLLTSAGLDLADSEEPLNETDFLVHKLDYLNKMLNPDYPGKKAIQLRLAHALFLASEENRIKADKGDDLTDYRQKSVDFSKRSLKLYKQLESVLKNQRPILYAESLFKQAYLERSLGHPSRSLSILKRLLTLNDIDPLWKTRAWYNIGEIEFELFRYKKALKAFDEVLKQKKSPWHFASRYRKIWSLFNLSLYEKAFQEFYSFVTSRDYSQTDLSLENKKRKQKLETEVEVLYSYISITNSRLDFLFNFLQSFANKSDPEILNKIAKLANLLKPIGRLKESNQVWRFYLSKTTEPVNQLLAYSSFLDNALALEYPDKLSELGEVTKKLLALQKKIGLYKPATLNIKRFFDQIHKNHQSFSEKQKLYLLSLYQESHSLYPKDFDLLVKVAELAKELKNYPLAMAYYQQAVLAITEPSVLKEDLCFKQLELAELSKKEALRLKAYSFYITNGTQDSLIFKSKYQTAYIYWTRKDFKKAQPLFYALAFYNLKKEDSSTKELKLKSAHLSLSALKQIGNQEELIIKQANEFRKAFVKNKKEFTKIYNLAILNQIKKWLEAKDFSYRPVQASTDKQVKKAFQLLSQFSVKEADKPELLSYYINHLLLAKELLKFTDMDRSIKALLLKEKLTQEDQKIVLTWKLWLAELRLDFKESLKIVQQLYPTDQSEENLLRLARLSELAGATPIPYYKKIIKKYPKSSMIPALVVSMLEKSNQKTQKMYLREYASFFSGRQEELITLILKTDQGDRDWEFMQAFLKLEFMKNSFLDRFLNTKKNRESFELLVAKTQKFSSNKNLKNTALRSYTQALNELIDNSETLLSTQDWLSRLYILEGLKKELLSFCNYVLGLDLPKNLNSKEQLKYKALLKEQIQPYRNQIQKLDQELNLLKSDKYLLSYQKVFQKNSVVQAYLKWEIGTLFKVLDDESFKARLQQKFFATQDLSKRSFKLSTNLKANSNQKISQKRIQSLYNHLKNKPFDLDTLKKLLEIETTRNNSAWAFYLAQRIKEVENKGKR